MRDSRYRLIAVTRKAHWKAYHQIRRTALFENRGYFGVYREDHQDEFIPTNFPLLLFYESDPVGTVRIDTTKRGFAIVRLVAISLKEHGKGHGSHLLKLAENFIRSKGYGVLQTFEPWVQYPAPDTSMMTTEQLLPV